MCPFSDSGFFSVRVSNSMMRSHFSIAMSKSFSVMLFTVLRIASIRPIKAAVLALAIQIPFTLPTFPKQKL